MSNSWRKRVTAASGAAALTVGVVAAGSGPAAAAGNHTYITQTNLVSDQPGVAPVTDPSLVNPWGMSFGTGATPTPVWVSNNGSDNTTLYRGATVPPTASKVPLTVSIPWGEPTGQVFNGSATDFMVSGGGTSAPAKFIFASESGYLTGWNPTIPGGATMAQTAVQVPGAIFKGLALGAVAGKEYLYAADFHNNKIDVFDSSFHMMKWAGAFQDKMEPMGYAPFNVQLLRGALYVTYAMQDKDKKDDVGRIGRGWVDVYGQNGKLIKRLVRHGALDSPWGLTLAPSSWGKYAGSLLVGNFGNGRIHSYNARTGHFIGTIFGSDAKPLTIEGLWGLMTGNGVAGDPQSVLFTAGPGDESHGLFGELTVPAA